MKRPKPLRYTMLCVLLLLGVWWSTSSAPDEPSVDYPNHRFLATPTWLMEHHDDDGLVIVDVRTDEHYHGEAIAGARRLPWSTFRTADKTAVIAATFVGIEEAQRILGDHGIMRSDTVVLYDSVERDGGATASYVFWILDTLGHDEVKILHGGIDAWIAAGGETTEELGPVEPVTYQAPLAEIQHRKLMRGEHVQARLGDPYYQIVDVRSEAEYVGQKGTKGLQGEPLKLGHVPTAYNVNYQSAWVDEQTKRIKPYPELQQLYRGLDPDRCVIV